MKCKNCVYNIPNKQNDEKYSWCVVKNDNTDIEIERECENYLCMTNADRIRKMTDEELAEWMYNITQFYKDDDVEQLEPMVSIYDLDKELDIIVRDSYGDLLEWLQKKVE